MCFLAFFLPLRFKPVLRLRIGVIIASDALVRGLLDLVGLGLGLASKHETGIDSLEAGGGLGVMHGDVLEILPVQISTRLGFFFEGIRCNRRDDFCHLTGGVLPLLAEIHYESHFRFLLFFCLLPL